MVDQALNSLGFVLNIENWKRVWAAFVTEDTANLRDVHNELLNRHSESHRHYHTTQHLAECLEHAAEILPLAEHPAEAEAALWFHDAIYDPRRDDNEARSAALARETALALRVDQAAAARIHDLILATRHTTPPESADARVVVDADLWILAAAEARFDEYEAQVRLEYDWVPEADYRTARAAVLNNFLDRERIYHTPLFNRQFEAQARANLLRSLRLLE